MKEMKNGSKILLHVSVFAAAYLLLCLVLAVLLRRAGVSRLTPVAAAALLAMLLLAVAYALETWQNIAILKKIENMMCGDEEQACREPEQKNLFLHMTNQGMLDQVYHQIHEASASRALKTEAELHALQNQINPHFLYNTLEIIRSRAIKRDNTDVAEMVEALGMLFRYCINSPGELATLAQELDNVRDYLLIQRYRYGDRFTYQEEIEDDSEAVMNSHIPVMTLQPIIENALVHGINPKVEGGRILLRVEAARTRLRIIVEDDGVGIPEDELKQVRRSLRQGETPRKNEDQNARSIGIAMKNVNKRIQFYFGSQYGVDVASTQGVGTAVTVTLPKIATESEEAE